MQLTPWRRRGSMFPADMDLSDFFHGFWSDDREPLAHLPEIFQGKAQAAVNLAENDQAFIVTMDCPGLDEDDITVDTMGNALVMTAERKWSSEDEEKQFRRVESQYGKFQRSVRLPDHADLGSDAVTARYEKGVLTVTIPKRQQGPSGRIPVKTVDA